MPVEPATPEGDAFTAAYRDLARRKDRYDVTYEGLQVRTWRLLGDSIMVRLYRSLENSDDYLGFIMRPVDADGVTRIYLRNQDTQLRGYCPDVVCLGPVTKFTSGAKLMSAAVRATCLMNRAGYKPSFQMYHDRTGALLAEMNVYRYNDNAMISEKFMIRGSDEQRLRLAAEQKIMELHKEPARGR